MSQMRNDFLRFNNAMQGFMGLTEEEANNSTHKPNFSLPLSKTEIKAFEGLCAIEGKSVKEKMAELVKNYIQEKRQKME